MMLATLLLSFKNVGTYLHICPTCFHSFAPLRTASEKAEALSQRRRGSKKIPLSPPFPKGDLGGLEIHLSVILSAAKNLTPCVTQNPGLSPGQACFRAVYHPELVSGSPDLPTESAPPPGYYSRPAPLPSPPRLSHKSDTSLSPDSYP